MSWKFTREPLASLLESGLEELARAHWGEVSHDRDVIAFNPDYVEMTNQESHGRFVCFAGREGGKLCGYSAFFVARSLHYRDHVFAVNDAIFLKPGQRGARGIAMILGAEVALKRLDVTKLFYHTKADANLGSPDGDSLMALEDLQLLEEELGTKLPDAVYSGGNTLGTVLEALGYTHLENNYGKLL